MSIDAAIAIAWDVFKSVVAPIKRQFGYVVYSKRHADDLQEKVRELANEVDRVYILAQRARNNVRIFYGEFTEWEASAGKDLKEAQDLLRDFQEASKTCCYETLPDPKCRYQFSRKAKDKIEVIRRLTQRSSGFKELNDISSSNPAPGNVAALPPVKDNGVFESRASIIRDIMDALADDSNTVVGVYGMGGVGKSTLLADVERRIRKEKSFDWVAKADVSENKDIKRIQGEIADGLGVTEIKNKETISGRAGLLDERLENEEKARKKVLIILDNLWKGLDLKSVGIPCGHDNKVLGCKLLLTSRFQDVLRREMNCDRDFLLGGLEEEEAKCLFERLVGDKVHDDEFKPLVDEALHKCAGLPFLIVVMAKHIRHADLSECSNALNQIEGCTNEEISEVINEMLRPSYDHLKSEEAKSLLQLRVAYGVSEPSLENLMRYSYGWGIFHKDSSIEEARYKFRALTHDLQASFPPLDNGGTDGFKINDWVLDFVARFIFRDHSLLVLKDRDMSAMQLHKEMFKSCTTICFPYIDMKELPKELECPELRMFLLFTNNESLEVPDSYFNSMKKLAVLNLTSVRLTRSPTPFQFLENLRTLSLQNCLLEDVAIVGKLKGLQILSFMNSRIEQLPKEIGQLAELRLLDLNHCSCLQIIEPGVLGRLIKLEELYMENSFNQWNAMEQTQPTNASLIELNHMKNLCTLYVCILDPTLLPEDLNVKKLTRYGIQIGGKCWLSHKGLRTLELQLNPKRDNLWKGFTQIGLDRADDLCMDELNGIEQSLYKLSPEGFPNLNYLHVENSPSVHYIFRQPPLLALRTLELLCLKSLINLEKICHTHVYSKSKSFSTLKVVLVENCDKMQVLFPLSLVRELPQLEEIRVVHCDLMREIVEADDHGKVELCNLQVLELRDLPNIKNFSVPGMDLLSSTSNDQVSVQVLFFSGQQVSIPSLDSLTMIGLPNLKYLWSDEFLLRPSNLRSLKVLGCKSLSNVINSISLVNLYKLQTLTIEDCNLVKEIFDLDGPSTGGNVETLSELITFSLARLPSLRHIWNMNPRGIVQFHDLKKVEVSNCDNLRFMFFSSMAKSLAKLRILRVWDCEKMEAIIMEEEGLGMETSKTLALPMLTNLQLGYLKSLTCFSCRECLREACNHNRVNSCSTIFRNREVVFPSLETLNITSMPNVEMIWDNQVYFQHLKTLDVSHCHQLTNMFTLTIARNLVALTRLRISNCQKLTEVFSNKGGKEEHVVAFNRLKSMELNELSRLRCFSSGGYTLMFPLLEDVIVTRCLNMKFFSKGPIETPKLEKVQVSIDAWFWNGNLNMTIQKMYEEMGTVVGGEFIKLSKFPDMIGKWHDALIPIEPFSKLESLVVDKCPSFVNAIPSTLMLALHNMRILQVCDCELLQEIFDLKGLESVKSTQVLPQLWHLGLVNLPELRRLWNKNLEGRLFNSLSHLTLYKCSNLRNAFSPLMIQCFATLEYMEINECGKIEGVIAEEEGHGSAVEKITFPSLWGMVLEYLPNLTSFLSRKNHTLECPNLKWLMIAHCPKMRSFSGKSLMEIDHGTLSLFTSQVAFPNLKTLYITHIDNIEMIWDNQIYFQHLKTLEVLHCDRLSYMFTPTIAENLVELTELRISNCQMLREVISDEVDKEGRVEASNQLKNTGPDWLRCFTQKAGQASAMKTIRFPNLHCVELECLPILTSFLSGNNYTLEWPVLEELTVDNCPKMTRIGMLFPRPPSFISRLCMDK